MLNSKIPAGFVLPFPSQPQASVAPHVVASPANIEEVPSQKIAVDDVRRVFENLEPIEAQLFERDLKIYTRTGDRSDFLNEILARAATDFH